MQADQISGAVARVRSQTFMHIVDAVVEQVAAGLTITRVVDGWRLMIDRDNVGVWSIVAASMATSGETPEPSDEVTAVAMFIAGEAGATFAQALIGATFTPAHNTSEYVPATFRLTWKERA